MASQPPKTMAGRLRRRAVEACSFCRKRKIKCNNERPECVNCKIYGKTCVYEPLHATGKTAPHSVSYDSENNSANPRRPGSSTRQSLSASSERPGGSLPSRQTPFECSAGSTEASRTTRDASSRRSVAQERDRLGPVQRNALQTTTSPGGESTYHGRTSTLFEDSSYDRASVAESQPRMPEEWIQKGLMAEAAKQHQLENYHFQTGQLDFDGVEPQLGMHLLSLHWNRQHHSFNITYRPAFMRDMACNGPYYSKLLLNAIYFGASKFSPCLEVRKDPTDLRTAGWMFRERVRGLLGTALDQSDVTTIQALLVMTNSLFALGDERSAAWLYSGLAFRMIVDLGMHVDVPSQEDKRRFSDEDLEIRRRVFWAAFIVDKIQSLYQGRPVTLKEFDTLVPIKFLDSFEEFESWKPFAYDTQASDYPGTPAYSVSTFRSLCHLSVAMSDILSTIYAERTFNQTPAELSTLLETLDTKLTKWKDQLPEHLCLDSKKPMRPLPPHVFSLNVLYHALVILLHRPFVADGHLYSTIRPISVNSFISCVSSADQIVVLLHAYDTYFSIRKAPYLISYACYVAATIHVRIAAKRGADSEAHGRLRACLAIFRENQSTNWAVKRAQAIIQNLMKRLGVREDMNESNAEIQRQAEQVSSLNPALGYGNANEGVVTAPHGSQMDVGQNTAPLQSELGYLNETGDGSGIETSSWSDIDGIIQSFARGQEASRQVFQPGLVPGNPSHQLEALSQSQTSRIPMMDIGTARPSFKYPVEEQGHAQWAEGIDNPLVDGSHGSIDDLLFGLNSAALDGYSF